MTTAKDSGYQPRLRCVRPLSYVDHGSWRGGGRGQEGSRVWLSRRISGNPKGEWLKPQGTLSILFSFPATTLAGPLPKTCPVITRATRLPGPAILGSMRAQKTLLGGGRLLPTGDLAQRRAWPPSRGVGVGLPTPNNHLICVRYLRAINYAII